MSRTGPLGRDAVLKSRRAAAMGPMESPTRAWDVVRCAGCLQCYGRRQGAKQAKCPRCGRPARLGGTLAGRAEDPAALQRLIGELNVPEALREAARAGAHVPALAEAPPPSRQQAGSWLDRAEDDEQIVSRSALLGLVHDMAKVEAIIAAAESEGELVRLDDERWRRL